MQALTSYEDLLKGGILTDIVIDVVGDRKFHAHKAILAARSPVFAAMFQHRETREALENRVEITNIDGDVFEGVLFHIYTGEIPAMKVEKIAVQYLAVADKYQLDSLKLSCEDFLCALLSLESVSRLLVLADLYLAPELKAKALDYMKKWVVQKLKSKLPMVQIDNSLSFPRNAGKTFEMTIHNEPEQVTEMFRQLLLKPTEKPKQ